MHTVFLVVGGIFWTIIGEVMALFYFDEVYFWPYSSIGKRKFVICDLFFVLLFGPFTWGSLVFVGLVWALKDVSFTWLSPSVWSEWVGKHCLFSKQNK